jgi:hypothetical protein
VRGAPQRVDAALGWHWALLAQMMN